MYLIWLRLRKLVKGKPKYNRSGICANLLDLTHKPVVFVVEKSGDWPFKSGCPVYPVPYERGSTGRYTAFLAYKEAENLWDFSTEYGQLRQGLCIHIMKKLEEESAFCRMLAKVVGRGV